MDAKITSILSYFGLVLWLVAYLAGDKEGAKFWLNQSLVLTIASIACSVVAVIPFIGWIVGGLASIAIFVFWIMGLIAAINQEEKPLPIIGNIVILK